MKRVPLYRAPLAGLMSLALATSALPPTAHADPRPHAHNPHDEDCHDGDGSKNVERAAPDRQEKRS